MTILHRISGQWVGGADTGGGNRPVEIWLRHTLSRSYDDVLTEALPEDWVRLVAAAMPADGNR